MSESGDYEPATWSRNVTADTAKRDYDQSASRSYAEAKKKDTKATDLVPKTLVTQSPNPIVLGFDLTGSMGTWPTVVFKKMGFFEYEGKYYLGEKTEISFAGITDAVTDEYPVQVRPFAANADLMEQLKKLVLEKGAGGGQGTESYELTALYYARRVEMPKAVHPIFIFIGDEAPHKTVNATHAKQYVYEDLKNPLTTKEVFEELKKKFAVYLVRKPYTDGNDLAVYKEWVELLGEDHIADLSDPERVADVIYGIFAKEAGRMDDFQQEIEGRQRPDQVEVAYKSLGTIHRLVQGQIQKKSTTSNSVTRRKKADGTVKRSEPLD